jgi:diguanylate cyclase (GGDEF)-like protein
MLQDCDPPRAPAPGSCTAGQLPAETPDGRSPGSRSRLPGAVAVLQCLPPVAVTALAVVLVCAIAVADGATGPDLSLNVFYLLVVILVSSTGRRSHAWFISLASAAGWLSADGIARGGYESWFLPLWNVTARFVVFSICAALVVALVAAVANERLVSRSDPLTGLANRRALHEHAERELARMARTGAPLTVAYLDIDRFKIVNDASGHAAGDAVLRAVGRTLLDQRRRADVVARVGGDEFAVLLPDTDSGTARVVTRRLRAALEALAVSSGWPVGFSVGAVTCTAPGSSTQELLDRADRLMYEVKRSGDDQTGLDIVPDHAARPVYPSLGRCCRSWRADSS